MNLKPLIFLLLMSLAASASAQTRIVCEPQNKNGDARADIWPEPYLLKSKLCFDIGVKSGSACVANGGSTSWLTEAVIVSIDGVSQGRDDTWFRVESPSITKTQISYEIEWTRDGKNWQPMRVVRIDRLSGQAASMWITSHGSDSYQCHTERGKLAARADTTIRYAAPTRNTEVAALRGKWIDCLKRASRRLDDGITPANDVGRGLLVECTDAEDKLDAILLAPAVKSGMSPKDLDDIRASAHEQIINSGLLTNIVLGVRASKSDRPGAVHPASAAHR